MMGEDFNVLCTYIQVQTWQPLPLKVYSAVTSLIKTKSYMCMTGKCLNQKSLSPLCCGQSSIVRLCLLIMSPASPDVLLGDSLLKMTAVMAATVPCSDHVDRWPFFSHCISRDNAAFTLLIRDRMGIKM